MATVSYEHEISYGYDPNGRRYPRLTLRIENTETASEALDSDAYLDSGPEGSVFDGRLAPLLGLDLLKGPEVVLQSVLGLKVSARLHRIRVKHGALGSFVLEAAFTTVPIGRNLLGRDFFALVQVGFRESRLTLYFAAQP